MGVELDQRTEAPANGELRVAPSILSADFAHLGAAVAAIEPVCSWLHVDVMDGHFVPNLTIGPPVVQSLRPVSQLFFDCHLMITNPERYLEAFKVAGADGCTVHVEVGNTAAHLDHMEDLGLRLGLAVNPDGDFSLVEPFMDRLDLLLVMTVFPGFGGQSFIADAMATVAAARAYATAHHLAVDIEVDGGIGPSTIATATEAGANVFVAGSAIFGAADPARAAAGLLEAATATRRSLG